MKDGVLQEVTTRATLEPTNGDTLSLRAEGILGVNVIALYQNLVAGGCASVVVSGTYRTWRPQALPPVVGGAAAPAFEVGVAPFSVTLELERKYEADAYRPRYTISGSDGQLRVIVNADDLHHFDLPQTEFIELRALGDVQARYPSISKLYLGVISRTVIVIPAHYVILRESAVCAATCNALVDSSPGVNAGCKFDFTFTLVPDVSSIDLALLINEINTRQEPELRGLQFHLPKRFNTTSNGSQFPNVFLSSTRFSNGANDPYSLTLSALIVEQAAGTPAVANANMFIAQLRSTSEPFLTGTVSIVLDDVYQGSVTSALMLNFKNTQASGNAGLSFSVEEANKQVVLQNDSAFSLQVDRVAFLTSDGTAVLPVAQVVPPAGSVSVESQAMRPDVQLLSDCEVAVGQTISRSELFKLLQFRTIDVQNTQFMFSINATDVNFAGRGINDIGVRVTLADAPAVSIPPMQVLQDRRFDSTRVVLPLLTAIGELKATVALVVTFTNASSPPKSFAVEHDFSQYPIFSLRDADVPA
jgi:hypothetical protein